MSNLKNGIQVLVVVASLFSAADAQETENQKQPPTVDRVLERYIDAIGGVKAIEDLRSAKMESEIEASGILSADSPLTSHFGLSQYRIMDLSGDTIGFDGQVHWSLKKSDDGDVRLNKSKRALYVDARNPIGLPHQIRALRPMMKALTDSSVEDHMVTVSLMPPGDKAAAEIALIPEEITFDCRSGLLESIRFRNAIYWFSDYRRVESVLVPHQISHRIGMPPSIVGNATESILSIELNIDIPDGFFDVPTGSIDH